MNFGEYLLRDHDLPFGGPLGLRRFIVDFLLSSAMLRIENGEGRVTGRVGGQILAEIPDSHPAHLLKDLYLLPTSIGLTRTITGIAAGTYAFHLLIRDGTSVSPSNVPTEVVRRTCLQSMQMVLASDLGQGNQNAGSYTRTKNR